MEDWAEPMGAPRRTPAEIERAACADLVRAAEPLIFSLLHKSYTRKDMAEKITSALTRAIEQRGA